MWNRKNKLGLVLKNDNVGAFSKSFTADHAECLLGDISKYRNIAHHWDSFTFEHLENDFNDKKQCCLIYYIIWHDCYKIAKWLDDNGYLEFLAKKHPNLQHLLLECCEYKSRIMPLIFDYVRPEKLQEIFEKYLFDHPSWCSVYEIRYFANHIDVNEFLRIGTWLGLAICHVYYSYNEITSYETISSLVDFGADFTELIYSGIRPDGSYTMVPIEVKLNTNSEGHVLAIKYAHERRAAIKEALTELLLPELADYVESFTLVCTGLFDLFINNPTEYQKRADEAIRICT